jgi:hypothetical protein
MSGNNRRRKPVASSTGGRTESVGPLERQMREELGTAVTRRLGLNGRETIPTDVQELVDAAAHELAESSVVAAIFKEVTRVAPQPLGASSGSGTVGAPADQTLLRDAERLAAKRKALRIAGFSNDEAMRLLVAEVNGLAAQQHALLRAPHA